MSTPQASTEIPHEAIAKLAAIAGGHALTTAEVGDVLNVSAKTVRRECNLHRIECTRPPGRGRGNKRAVQIGRGAVIRYLVRSTTGDRVVLMTAIAQAMPQFLGIAKEAAGSAAGLAPLPPLPANAIDGRDAFKSRKQSRTKDQAAGHPEMFPEMLA